MTDKQIAPYGAWNSPITADMIVSAGVGLGAPRWYGDDLLWLESRPQEGGRNVIVHRTAAGVETDVTPAPFNVRSRVHEYGGGAWLLAGDAVYFVNFTDQQVWRQAIAGGEASQVTHVDGCRFANGTVDSVRNRLVYVMEDHRGKGEAVNSLVAVDLDSGEITNLTGGHDFFASPALSPDGARLAFITWDHPDMPWDETALWCCNLDAAGEASAPQLVAGGVGQDEAVQQPRFSPGGILHYVSDRSGWWNLYREDNTQSLAAMAAEFGGPHWGFGQSNYRFLAEDELLCLYGIDNQSHLAILKAGEVRELSTGYTSLGGLAINGRQLATLGASPSQFGEIALLELDAPANGTVIKRSAQTDLDPANYSVPETITFPSAENTEAHAFFYPPTNPGFEAPTGTLPPLVVIFHGGPTGATHNVLSLRTQFWTSRGFALLDVNYRGSTGYGRQYRNALRGGWGIVDVEDAKHGAEYLVREQRVDGKMLAIRGGSAGGYTTLAALTFTDTFTAGASHYGVSDLEALAKETHKFESRYLDSMVGAYPEERDKYVARSPVHHTEGLDAACIFFQGLEDKVVPPNQAEMMVDALKSRGKPVAYVPFEGEQHGFRQAANIRRSLELELYFYGRVFGFTPADKIDPIPITNLDP